MRNAKKIAVQPAKSTQFYSCRMIGEILQSDLVGPSNVMMSHVRWIANDKAVASRFHWYLSMREVTDFQIQRGPTPEPLGRISVGPINLECFRVFDSKWRHGLQ